MSENNQLTTRDWLAIERTRLANERTFLAYFRTTIVFLGSGISILEIEFFSEVRVLGIVLTALSPVLLIIGIMRLLHVKKNIKKYYKS